MSHFGLDSLVLLARNGTTKKTGKKQCKHLHTYQYTTGDHDQLPFFMNESLAFVHTALGIVSHKVLQAVGLANALYALETGFRVSLAA